jgi:tRNA A37 threonylcarbamoyladenosine dehydratase
MRNPAFQRLSLLAGADGLQTLEDTRAIVFGVGGVGSWCAEALVRSGIGHIALVDSDTVCVTNINRQVQATSATVGKLKVDALKDRLLQINPACDVVSFASVFSKETAVSFGIESADYVIDAIDSLTYKLDLIEYSGACNTTLYSCMGMAQKFDPTRIKTADIWQTAGCPLATLVRSGLRKRGFAGHFTAVYSSERIPAREGIEVSCGTGQCLCPARKTNADGTVQPDWCSAKKIINGSAVTVTAAAGLVLASLVIQDVLRSV